MTVITASLGTTGSISGISATALVATDAEAADDGVIYGLPAVVRGPDPTPNPAPDGVRAWVLNASDTFVCHLPNAQGLHWTDEFNTAGSGSIDVRRYEDLEAKHPGLWNAGAQVMIAVGGNQVFRLVLDSEPGYQTDTDNGNRIDSRQGVGALGVLNSGMCEPEYGWRAEATDERSFDYGSNPTIGGWYVPAEWRKPVGRLLRKSWRWTFKKRHLPKGMRDKKAQWLWWKDPDSTNAINETCYFMGSFSLSQPRRVRIEAAGDDTLELQVDGEVQITTGPGEWRRATTIVLNLSAGTHRVAAKVSNTPGSVGNQNRSGFICSIARMDGNGNVVAWLLRTAPTTWKIRRQRTSPPGWFAAQILRQLVLEQKTRGCAGHAGVTFNFNTVSDSHGVAWAGRQEIGVTVGTLGLDYVQQLVETGIDVAMSPGLVLSAWRTRGSDRSGWVKLDQGTGRRLAETGSQPPAVRNVLYAKASTGWAGRTATSSVTARGRRETMVALGSARSPSHTSATLASMLPDMSDPPQTIEVRISGARGPQPYRDFLVGDWVGFRNAGATTWHRFRVMAVSGEVSESGYPDWTIKLYED